MLEKYSAISSLGTGVCLTFKSSTHPRNSSDLAINQLNLHSNISYYSLREPKTKINFQPPQTLLILFNLVLS